MKHTAKLLARVLAVLLCLHTAAVDAVIVYQQNFDGLTTGTINGQDGWVGAASDVVQTGTALGVKALEVVSSDTAYHLNIFAPLTSPTNNAQQVGFDFRLPSTILDYIGTPNVDIQEAIQFRGPTAFHESFLVYKGTTDGTGALFSNRIELRTRGPANVSTTTVSPHTIQKDTWYHINLQYNWANFILDGEVQANGSTYWDPAPQSIAGGFDGNVNQIILSADSIPGTHFFFDNFFVDVPEPSSVALLGLGGLLLWRRRG